MRPWPAAAPSSRANDAERSALIIERHQRGAQDRLLLKQQQQQAAETVERVYSGHSKRNELFSSKRATGSASSTSEVGRFSNRRGIEARVVLCGSELSGVHEHANWLATELKLRLVLLHDDGDNEEAAALLADRPVQSGWVLAGTPTAATCAALLALPLPPTHWVMLTVDDSTAEARGVASLQPGIDELDAKRAVRERLRRWKRRMLGVYAVRPASEFERLVSSGLDADDSSQMMLHREMLRLMEPSDEAPCSTGEGEEAERVDVADEDVNLRRALRLDEEESVPELEREWPRVLVFDAGGPTYDRERAVVSGSSPGARAQRAAEAVAHSAERRRQRVVPLVELSVAAAHERVDEAASLWRGRRMVSQLAPFSSELVRRWVPLDGQVLISLAGAEFTDAFKLAWSHHALLCCAFALVDAHGAPLAEVDEQRTSAAHFDNTRTSEVWWNAEVGMRVPRHLLNRTDVLLQLTVLEAATSTPLAYASRPLHELLRYSVGYEGTIGGAHALGEPWRLERLGPGYERTEALAPLGVAHARLLVIDLVSTYDRLAAISGTLEEQLRVQSTVLGAELQDCEAHLEAQSEALDQWEDALTEEHEQHAYAVDAAKQALREADGAQKRLKALEASVDKERMAPRSTGLARATQTEESGSPSHASPTLAHVHFQARPEPPNPVLAGSSPLVGHLVRAEPQKLPAPHEKAQPQARIPTPQPQKLPAPPEKAQPQARTPTPQTSHQQQQSQVTVEQAMIMLQTVVERTGTKVAFDTIDENHGGSVSADELVIALRKLQVVMEEEAAQEMILAINKHHGVKGTDLTFDVFAVAFAPGARVIERVIALKAESPSKSRLGGPAAERATQDFAKATAKTVANLAIKAATDAAARAAANASARRAAVAEAIAAAEAAAAEAVAMEEELQRVRAAISPPKRPKSSSGPKVAAPVSPLHGSSSPPKKPPSPSKGPKGAPLVDVKSPPRAPTSPPPSPPKVPSSTPSPKRKAKGKKTGGTAGAAATLSEAQPHKPPRQKPSGASSVMPITSSIEIYEGKGAPPIPQQLMNALRGRFARMIDLFREWDESGDGRIQCRELQRAMAHLGLEVEPRHVAALFRSWDVDSSGQIELRELETILRGKIDETILRDKIELRGEPPGVSKAGAAQVKAAAVARLAELERKEAARVQAAKGVSALAERPAGRPYVPSESSPPADLFSAIDRNGDGRIDRAEWNAAFAQPQPRVRSQSPPPERLSAAAQLERMNRSRSPSPSAANAANAAKDRAQLISPRSRSGDRAQLISPPPDNDPSRSNAAPAPARPRARTPSPPKLQSAFDSLPPPPVKARPRARTPSPPKPQRGFDLGNGLTLTPSPPKPDWNSRPVLPARMPAKLAPTISPPLAKDRSRSISPQPQPRARSKSPPPERLSAAAQVARMNHARTKSPPPATDHARSSSPPAEKDRFRASSPPNTKARARSPNALKVYGPEPMLQPLQAAPQPSPPQKNPRQRPSGRISPHEEPERPQRPYVPKESPPPAAQPLARTPSPLRPETAQLRVSTASPAPDKARARAPSPYRSRSRSPSAVKVNDPEPKPPAEKVPTLPPPIASLKKITKPGGTTGLVGERMAEEKAPLKGVGHPLTPLDRTQPRAIKPSPPRENERTPSPPKAGAPSASRPAPKDVAESRVSRELRGARGTRGGPLESRADMAAPSPPKEPKEGRAQSPPKEPKAGRAQSPPKEEMSHVQTVHAARMAEIASKKERDRAEAAKEAAEKASKMPLSPPPMPWLKEEGKQQFVDVRTILRKPIEQELKMKARLPENLPENARSKQMFWGAMDASWEGNVRVDRALLDSSLATMSGGATALKRHVLDPSSTSPAMARPPGQARAPPPPPEEPQPRAAKPSPRSATKDVAESRVSRESHVSRELRGARGTRGGPLESRADMAAPSPPKEPKAGRAQSPPKEPKEGRAQSPPKEPKAGRAQSPPKEPKAGRAQSPPKDSKEVAKAQAFWGAMEGKAEGKGPVAKTSPAPSVAPPAQEARAIKAQEESRALLDRSLATMSGGVDALNSRALYSAQHP